jgi:hypothetical protein
MYRAVVLVLCLAAIANATWVNSTHFLGQSSPATFQVWLEPAAMPYYLEVKLNFREVSDLYTLQFSGNPVTYVQKDKVVSGMPSVRVSVPLTYHRHRHPAKRPGLVALLGLSEPLLRLRERHDFHQWCCSSSPRVRHCVSQAPVFRCHCPRCW